MQNEFDSPYEWDVEEPYYDWDDPDWREDWDDARCLNRPRQARPLPQGWDDREGPRLSRPIVS